jgi:VanZ family protein
VLFLPLGFLLTALWRRQWIGFVVALVVSAGAEIAQLALPARTAAPRDVLANVSGALIGGAIAWLLLHRRRPRSRSSAGRR